MTYILFYLLRMSISLSAMYLFYLLFLRPLTFYQWNRFYLVGYSLLSVVIPIVDVRSWIADSSLQDSRLLHMIPSIERYTAASSVNSRSLTDNAPDPSLWILMSVFIIGAAIVLSKLVLQRLSLQRLKKKAVLVMNGKDAMLYEVDEPVGPFSFGKAIYFNPQMHSEEELQRIIQHEFVHVKQKHTIDLIIGESICVLNWFNPFAWLIRYAIRQNLEFIADKYVIEKGFDKKEYQYLLLKVVGLSAYRMANHFNLPNLKKRIAMMNKMNSAKLHLAKFLFILPMLAVLLLAFRDNRIKSNQSSALAGALFPIKDTIPPPPPPPPAPPPVIRNTGVPALPKAPAPPVPPAPPAAPAVVVNSKGYILSVANNNGECVVIVKDAGKKILHAFTLEEWNKNQANFERRYGPIPGPDLSAVPDASLNQQKDEIVFRAARINMEMGDKPNPPMILVNSVEQPNNFTVSNIDPESIESVQVFKDKSATDKYGDKGKNGVIIIRTKTAPLYIIDGEEVHGSGDPLTGINPENILSVTVLKDKMATDKYGEKGKNGVVEVVSKNPQHK